MYKLLSKVGNLVKYKLEGEEFAQLFAQSRCDLYAFECNQVGNLFFKRKKTPGKLAITVV